MLVPIIFFIALRIVQKPDTASFWIGDILVPCGLAFFGAFCALFFALIIARYVRFHQIMELVMQHAEPPFPKPENTDSNDNETEVTIEEKNLLYARGLLNRSIDSITQLETTTKRVRELLRSEFFPTASSHLSDIERLLDMHYVASLMLICTAANALEQRDPNKMYAVGNDIWAFRRDAQRAIAYSMIVLRGAKPTARELWPFPAMFRRNEATTRSEAKLASFNQYHEENFDGQVQPHVLIRHTWDHAEGTTPRPTNTTPPTETDQP